MRKTATRTRGFVYLDNGIQSKFWLESRNKASLQDPVDTLEIILKRLKIYTLFIMAAIAEENWDENTKARLVGPPVKE